MSDLNCVVRNLVGIFNLCNAVSGNAILIIPISQVPKNTDVVAHLKIWTSGDRISVRIHLALHSAGPIVQSKCHPQLLHLHAFNTRNESQHVEFPAIDTDGFIRSHVHAIPAPLLDSFLQHTDSHGSQGVSHCLGPALWCLLSSVSIIDETSKAL